MSLQILRSLGQTFSHFLLGNEVAPPLSPLRDGVFRVEHKLEKLHQFLEGHSWKIAPEESDLRARTLDTVDFSQFAVAGVVQPWEDSISGELYLHRSKTGSENLGYIRLGVGFFLCCWENQQHLPPFLKEKVDGQVRFILFDGDVLEDKDGKRYMLFMFHDELGWDWGMYAMTDKLIRSDQSAVISLYTPFLTH